MGLRWRDSKLSFTIQDGGFRRCHQLRLWGRIWCRGALYAQQELYQSWSQDGFLLCWDFSSGDHRRVVHATRNLSQVAW